MSFHEQLVNAVFASCNGKTVSRLFVPDRGAGLRIVFTDGTGFIVEAEHGRLVLSDLTDEDT